MGKNQISNLQAIRAIAALAVVFDHTFATSLKGIVDNRIYIYMHDFLNNLGWLGVNVFFVLSGFLMIFTQKKDKNSFEFLSDRIVRIYPPYMIYSTPIIIYALFSAQYDHRIENTVQLLQNIFLIPGIKGFEYKSANFPSWTLVYEMFFYFIFSIVLFFSRNKIKISIMVSTFLIIILAYMYLRFGGVDTGNLTDFIYMTKNVILLNFVSGCLLGAFINKNSLKKNNKFLVPLVITMFLFLSAIRLILNQYINDDIVSIFIGVIPSTFIILFALRYEEVKMPTINLIGDASYSIYLTHVSLLFIKNKIMSFIYSGDSIWIIILGNLLFVLLSTVIGVVLYRTIEKPIIQKLKKKQKIIILE
ncbi:acyltransferase family protein [Raoultella planticola]|uniref:acyltransferase family protein n=1 Tax=Raoultella TaxID=160674 RepID=UPI00066D8432|nr:MULTISPECIES: acyltransferase [Raoultella]EJR0224595.1 acyltransferase [Raoultella planticola]QLK15739.1 acyltransferase family protein [Raoultella ornithinolytica]